MQVWLPDPRIVKISSAYSGQFYSWTASSAVGDTEIIQSLTLGNVSFSVDVTSDKTFPSYIAGNTIPAATIISPSDSTGTATFTEVI